MTTTYLTCPAGHPVTVFRVRKAGRRWAIQEDVWWTPTAHNGWRDSGDHRCNTRREAQAIIDADEDSCAEIAPS